MDKKIFKKIEKVIEENFKIIKKTKLKTYFEICACQGSYNNDMKTQTPQWFKAFATEMLDFKKEMIGFKKDMTDFKNNQEKFNAKQEKFNSEIKSSIQGINTRIDNLVTKNDLSE